MEIAIYCDGDSVTEELLKKCVEDSGSTTFLSYGPAVCGMAARTGDIWTLTFSGHNVSQLVRTTHRFMHVLRKTACAPISIERNFCGDRQEDRNLDALLGHIDWLTEEIRKAASDLKKTRSLIGNRKFAAIRRRLEEVLAD